MRELYLTYARRRAVFGAQTSGMRSRFLDEIPTELLDESQEPARWGAGAGLGRLHAGVGAPAGVGVASMASGVERLGLLGYARDARPPRRFGWARTSCTPHSATAWSPASSRMG